MASTLNTTARPALPDFVAFGGTHQLAAGALTDVVVAAWHHAQANPDHRTLLFHGPSSQALDLPFEGPLAAVLALAGQHYAGLAASHTPQTPEHDTAPAQQAPAARGRPRLGVVPREVTLLPRHWDWLATQPGGASVTLRRLVEQARKAGVAEEQARGARDLAYRFMSTMASALPGFEEASRALFAGDAQRFGECTAHWPADIVRHLRRLAAPGLGGAREEPAHG